MHRVQYIFYIFAEN